LAQHLEKKFQEFEALIDPPVTDETKKKTNFYLNNLDEQKFSEIIKDIQQKVEMQNVSDWLGLNIIWTRVPKEPRYHELYKN